MNRYFSAYFLHAFWKTVRDWTPSEINLATTSAPTVLRTDQEGQYTSQFINKSSVLGMTPSLFIKKFSGNSANPAGFINVRSTQSLLMSCASPLIGCTMNPRTCSPCTRITTMESYSPVPQLHALLAFSLSIPCHLSPGIDCTKYISRAEPA
ncbi:PQ loop repeat [Cordyceps militaris]|uniref:PQ loop repeat n=1 Tax=Cordyceps militaris TaxID=73501 RepID=A0A2H4SKR6_CORMI|nr:PQ loop repeat [Cordyceps militaris]